MDCKTAQKVWGHPDGFLEGLKSACPGVLERLETVVRNLIDGNQSPFSKKVQEKVGALSKPYHVEHAEDDDELAHLTHDVVGDVAANAELSQHFSNVFGQQVCIGNVCCSGCKASLGPLKHEELVAIQNAAVRTAPDGTDIEL
jgi:hypothetical protein